MLQSLKGDVVNLHICDINPLVIRYTRSIKSAPFLQQQSKMAMTNFTVHPSDKSYMEHRCSTELAERRTNQLLVLIGLNLFVSVTAFLGNALILAALHKESSLHPPSKLLYRNLATTDLAVGIIAEPFYVTYLISVLNEQWHICRFAVLGFNITAYILCAVSLLTLSAISVDRLLALLSGLRYRQVVTWKRIFIICIVFWFVCIINSTMLFWNQDLAFWGRYIIIVLCLVISAFSYAKIFFTLRRRDQVHAQGQQNQNVLPNRARYKKAVYSALWVQLILVLCSLPHVITKVFHLQKEESPSPIVASSFTATLVFLNSSLNPLLYCWKIKEVRRAVKDIVKGLFCSSS